MSDTGYWTSLRGAGIFIYLFLFCLFLGIAAFGYLYDRISTFEIWNSPVWLKIKVPLIIFGVIGFVAGVLALARYTGQKELQAARQYAQTQGWDFSRDDTPGIKAAVAAILPFLTHLHVYYVRTVEIGQRSLYLFNCSYNHEKDAAGRRSSYGVACLIQSDRFSPAAVPVDIVGRDWTEIMISDKVDMGESPFAEKFLVLSKDPAAAQKTVNESIQAIMLEHLEKPLYNPVDVTIGPGGAVVLTSNTAEPERLHDLVDLAYRVEAAVE